MSTLRRLGLLAGLGALAGLALTGCGSSSSNGSSPASVTGAAAKVSCPNGQLRFGIEPYEDPAKLTPAYTVLANALQAKLGCPVKLQIVQNYSAEVLAMRNGQLELAEFGPLGYVFANQKAGAEAVASFADGTGKLTTYKAGLWVPASSPITSIAQLKGHTVALSSAGSTSGDALPRYAFKKAGLAAGDVKLEYAGGHPQSLLALTNGKVDAAEVNTQEQATATAAGKFDSSKYRKIWESDPVPNDPVTVAGSLSPDLKQAITQAMLQLSPSDVAQVGSFLDVNPPGPMVSVTKQTYQPLFDLASTLGLTEKDVCPDAPLGTGRFPGGCAGTGSAPRAPGPGVVRARATQELRRENRPGRHRSRRHRGATGGGARRQRLGENHPAALRHPPGDPGHRAGPCTRHTDRCRPARPAVQGPRARRPAQPHRDDLPADPPRPAAQRHRQRLRRRARPTALAPIAVAAAVPAAPA